MEPDENHDEADHTNDREIFLAQLETDREMRSRVNLYKDGDHVDDEDEEGVRLGGRDEGRGRGGGGAEDFVVEGVMVRRSGNPQVLVSFLLWIACLLQKLPLGLYCACARRG